jgi:flagellin
MSRINTNVNALVAQHALQRNNASLSKSMTRLATGLKINSGADDPAGMIASQNLRADKAGITQAIDNAGRASNVLGTAEGGLNEISSLLTEMQTLTTQTANTGGLSTEEVQANQLQVDSILSTINRISGSTKFEGMSLLNGNLAYSTSSVAASAFTNIQINSARLPDAQKVTVVVNVVSAATQGSVVYTATATHTTLASACTVTISGNEGSEQLSFASGTALSAVAAAVNGLTGITGVTATMSGTATGVETGSAINFQSQKYGSSQYVSVQIQSDAAGTLNGLLTGGTNGRDTGTNANVTVNGGHAEANGVTVKYRTSDLDLEFDMATGATGLNTDATSKTFGIVGGGATFMLGSKANETGKASIGIMNVSSANLGDAAVGMLNQMASGQSLSLSSGKLGDAQKTLDRAIKQVSELRGRIGAFQKYTVGSTVNSLNVALENASAAESTISDTDFSSETAALTRSQVLQQASTNILSQANSAPQSALSLLRG